MTVASAAAVAHIRAKLFDEQRIRDGLALSETGQIADSYDTLHSVRLVGLILDTVPETLSDGDRAAYLFFIIARCVDANLVELCDWGGQDLADGRIDQAADRLLWIERLLGLKHAIGLFRPAPEPRRFPAERSAASVFLSALDALGDAVLAYFDSAGIPAIAAADTLGTVDALIVQRAKNIVLLAKEDAAADPLPSDVDAAIVEAHLDCVTAATAGLAMACPTHINQFCLLHQLPELIVPTVLRLWAAIETDIAVGDRDAALEKAHQAGDLLSIMVLAIAPLAEILYPSEYFKFRANLGATSGSSSAAIRGRLLTGAYVQLAERIAAADRAQDMADPAHRRLMAQIGRNRELLYRWRALHAALPRNVLGSGGTKSLMGSSDALKAVRSMVESFVAKDPLTAIFGRIADHELDPGGGAARLDAVLLAETGRVARDTFWQVQDRVGTWARVRKVEA